MLGKARILVIDDEEDICHFTKSALERTGKFEVQTSTDALAGIQMAKATQPDLIILDINMPKLDGGGVAQQLREFNVTKDIPLIFLTALLRKEEAEQAAGKIGNQYYLAKPIAPAELAEKIRSILKL